MKTHVKIVIFVFTTTLWVNLAAQTPEWIDPIRRAQQYSEQMYLTGFASEKNVGKDNPSELLKRLENYAKAQIAEYIQVTVQSEATLSVNETNKNFNQTFSSIKHSSTNLILSGLKIQTFYNEKEKTGYAFAFAKRSELLNFYRNELEKKLAEAERLLAQANQLVESNMELSFKTTLDVLNLIPLIEQSQSVILALKRTTNDANDNIERINALKTGIDNILRQTNGGNSKNLDEACFFLAKSLHLQAPTLPNPVLVSNFTYQDTKMASEFSTRINQSLSSRLINTAGYRIESLGTNTTKYIITGTYWKQENEIKLIAQLKEVDGNIIATAEAIIPLKWIEANNLKYLPENFEQAYTRMKVFSQNELIRSDLNVEVFTNKGTDNLVFTKGEKLKFYVRANKECYLRFIYHLADNQSVLMLDNYYVASHMVNQVIELPDEFECDEPFGVEVLQINAQTHPFPKLNTRKQYGYEFITESLEETVVKTRGFVKTTDKMEKAEKRLVFTTLAK